ncbi:Hypothetical protein Cp106_1365 [Corynebacterium pseudotuberculosis 1/06-A]|nr:Hypothetical protein Cp106_1365 [Corynebacterium pseudotuberculosis 1/06-A]
MKREHCVLQAGWYRATDSVPAAANVIVKEIL